MAKSPLARLINTSLLAMATAALLPAAPITVPPGLNPGDQYRLVFVTADTRDATSSTIEDYDNFVTTQAESNALLAALNTTWRVIGSTNTVNAFDHIGGPFSTRIFNLGGLLVATGSADLCDGSIGSPISFDQYGNENTRTVFTGASPGCTGSPNPFGRTGTTVVGSSAATDLAWMSSAVMVSTTSGTFYGITGVLTVQDAPVPEPATMALLALGLVGLWWRRPRHKSR